MFIGRRSFRQVRGHVAAVTVEGCVIEIRFVGNLHVRIIFEKVVHLKISLTKLHSPDKKLFVII